MIIICIFIMYLIQLTCWIFFKLMVICTFGDVLNHTLVMRQQIENKPFLERWKHLRISIKFHVGSTSPPVCCLDLILNLLFKLSSAINQSSQNVSMSNLAKIAFHLLESIKVYSNHCISFDE